MSNLEYLLQNSTSSSILQKVLQHPTILTFHHSYHILYDLRTLLGSRKDPIVYMEIGAYLGASAALILQHPLPTIVHTIDPLNLPKSRFKFNLSQHTLLENNLKALNPHQHPVYIHRCRSDYKPFLRKLRETNIQVDILFIDGCHSKIGVKTDIRNYVHLVRPGGFIVFDDYQDKKHSPAVKVVVDNFINQISNQNLPYNIIGSLPNYQNVHTRHKQNRNLLNNFILQRKSNVQFCTHGVMRGGIHVVLIWLVCHFPNIQFFNNISDPTNLENRLLSITDSRVENFKQHLHDGKYNINIPAIYSYESQPINQTIINCQHIIILRDPYQNLDSIIEYTQQVNESPSIAIMLKENYFIQLWLSHAYEALRDTLHHNNVTLIQVDKFLQNAQYRKQIASKLNIPNENKNINLQRSLFGGGSSFIIPKSPGSIRHLNHPVMQALQKNTEVQIVWKRLQNYI